VCHLNAVSSLCCGFDNTLHDYQAGTSGRRWGCTLSLGSR
jgi:hypothetical protein